MAGRSIQYPEKLESQFEYTCLVGRTHMTITPAIYPDHWNCRIYIAHDRHEQANKMPLWHTDVADWLAKHGHIDARDHLWFATPYSSEPEDDD